MYPSPKVHKPPDDKGDPKSRPVVLASTCITSRPDKVLADILEVTLQSMSDNLECQSTEEMLAKINRANDTIEKEAKDIYVGSGDAIALYTSLQHEASAKYCSDLIKRCPARFANVDTRAAGVFVVAHCDREETYRSDQPHVKEQSGCQQVQPGQTGQPAPHR